MSDDRMIIAIGRIERALSRIEALAEPATGTLRTLQDKHTQLRSETSSALAELDVLIGRIKEGGNG